MLLCETIQWTMIGFNSVQWPRKQNYSDILEKISGSLCFPWAARAVLFAMSIQTEYRKAGEESRSPILPIFAPLVMRGREACKQACMHAWVRVCRGFQLHVQFCWVVEWVRKTIYDLITVPIVNHEDCRFKYPNRSWDAKVIRGQNGDSPFSLNACLELLDCVKHQTQNSVSMHACMDAQVLEGMWELPMPRTFFCRRMGSRNYLIEVAIVNHEHCCFKYQDWSWDEEAVTGQNEDSSFI